MGFTSKKFTKFTATGASAALVATALVPAASADEVKTAAFTDVASQYETAVEFVVGHNIAKGFTDTQFGINAQIKRGDAAIMIAQAAGLMDEDAPVSGFTDVPERGQLAVNSLKAAGVVNGKSATQFDFHSEITRGEAALMLARAYELTGDTEAVPFTDVIGTRYDNAVAALVASEVTQGINATQFGTHANIKRGDFARFLYRLGVEEEPGDTTAPVLSYNGETTINLNIDDEFVLPVVVANDNVDGELTVDSEITNEAGETVTDIDTSVAGTYTITYQAVDAAGNVSEELVVTVVVNEDAGLEVSNVEAINPTTLLVTFSNGETTEVELPEALVEGDQEVSFEIDGITYTGTVTFNAALYAQQEAEAAILTLPAHDDITLEDAEAIAEVRALVDTALEFNPDAEIEGLETLVAAEEAIAALQTEADVQAAVTAFEEIHIETFGDVAAAAEAQAAAEEAVSTVANEEVRAALQERIDAQIAVNEAALADTVTTVNEAANQVELSTALQNFFENFDKDLIAEYDNALNGDETSVEEIQSVINEVNTVVAVRSATTQVALLEALNSEFLTNVDSDLIVEYDEAITGSETTIAELQTVIDVVNTSAAVAVLVDAEGNLTATQEEITAAQNQLTALIDAGVTLPDTNENGVTDLQELINEAQNLLDLQVQISEAEAAVNALVDAEGHLMVGQTEITEAQTQVTALVDAGVTLPDTDSNGVSDLQELIDTAQELYVDEVTATVEGLFDAEGNLVATQEDITAAQAQVTALVDAGVTLPDTDSNGINDLQDLVTDAQETFYVQITDEITASLNTFVDAEGNLVATQEDIDTVQGLIDVLVENGQTIDIDTDGDGIVDTTLQLQLDNIQDQLNVHNIYVATTGTELQPLLVDLELANYNNLTSAQRLEVADLFLNVLATNDYATTTEVSASLDTEVGSYVNALNAVSTATSIETADTALEALNVEEYNSLTASEQLVAAENVLNNTPESGYTSIAQIIAQF